MSVIYLSSQIYEDCEASLRGNGYTTNGNENCLFSFLDWNYYDDQPQTKFQKLFNELYLLNALSYADRYNEGIRPPKPLNFDKGKAQNPYQLLKSLECINYQIEVEDNPHVETLHKLIKELTHRLIESNPDYKTAKWSY